MSSTPTTVNSAPSMRTTAPSGEPPAGNSVDFTSSPITAAWVAARSSCSVKKRPLATPTSRISCIAAPTPLMVVSSRVRSRYFTTAPPC